MDSNKLLIIVVLMFTIPTVVISSDFKSDVATNHKTANSINDVERLDLRDHKLSNSTNNTTYHLEK